MTDNNAAYHQSGMADDDDTCCQSGAADDNATYPCGGEGKDNAVLVVALPPLVPPSCPLAGCAALLLCWLVVAWPTSNAAAPIKSHHHQSLLSTAAAAATRPPPPPLPLPWSNSLLSIAKERGSSTTTTRIPTAAPT